MDIEVGVCNIYGEKNLEFRYPLYTGNHLDTIYNTIMNSRHLNNNDIIFILYLYRESDTKIKEIYIVNKSDSLLIPVFKYIITDSLGFEILRPIRYHDFTFKGEILAQNLVLKYTRSPFEEQDPDIIWDKLMRDLLNYERMLDAPSRQFEIEKMSTSDTAVRDAIYTTIQSGYLNVLYPG